MSEITHLKPPVPPSQFEYKHLKQGEFWRHIPAYREIDEATFLDHLWQQKNAVKTPQELLATIKDLVLARSSLPTWKKASRARRWPCASRRTRSR